MEPIREQAHYTEEVVGSVAVAEMLYKTNLVEFKLTTEFIVF